MESLLIVGDRFLQLARLPVGVPEGETNLRRPGIPGQKSFVVPNGTFQVTCLLLLHGASENLLRSVWSLLRQGPSSNADLHQKKPATKNPKCPQVKHARHPSASRHKS